MELQRFRDHEQLSRAAANYILRTAEQSFEARGAFHLCLSGGSTPRRVYEILAEGTSSDPARWRQVLDAMWFYWGDERCVPPDHPDSNHEMARKALLSQIDPPAGHVRRMLGEVDPDEAARQYEIDLRSTFQQTGKPTVTFDLLMLGIGPDGHTASLFPGSSALDEHERWAVPVPAPDGVRPSVKRLTLTLPALNASRMALFLVIGREKRDILRKILLDPETARLRYPAARVQTGRLLWMVDRDAWPGDDDEVST